MKKTPKIELGNTAPLVLDERHGPERFQRASVAGRWTFGFATTGVTATLLMAGALWTTLDGRHTPAAASRQSEAAPNAANAPKGDLTREMNAIRSDESHSVTIPVAVVQRGTDRTMVETRPYRFVSQPLSRTRPQDGQAIPAYNLASIIGSTPSSATASDEIYGGSSDVEFSVEIVPFPVDMDEEGLSFAEGAEGLHPAGAPMGGPPPATPGAEAAARVAEPADLETPMEFVPDLPSMAPNLTVLDANITELVKSADVSAGAAADTFVDFVQVGDTMVDILVGSGLTTDDANALADLARDELGGGSLQPRDIVEIAFTVAGEGASAGRKVERFTAYRDGDPLVSLGLADDGSLTVARPHRETAPTVDGATAVRSSGGRPTVYEGIYRVGLEEGLSEGFIGKLVRAFAFEVDLTRSVGPGDRIRFVYTNDEMVEDGQAQEPSGELLFASLRLARLEYRVYRFRDPANDEITHFDERGRSTSRLLLRKPIGGGVFRSGFGMRRHPILNYRKMHPGVDWAAPRGTPIYASGHATVALAGWQSGYGRAVRLRLDNGYEAFYAHMSRIAEGLRRGHRVRQGDIIGYVGTTGLSTGNHLHYELSINGRRVDPMNIRIPRDRELSGEALLSFQEERTRIDALVDKAHEDILRSAM